MHICYWQLFPLEKGAVIAMLTTGRRYQEWNRNVCFGLKEQMTHLICTFFLCAASFMHFQSNLSFIGKMLNNTKGGFVTLQVFTTLVRLLLIINCLLVHQSTSSCSLLVFTSQLPLLLWKGVKSKFSRFHLVWFELNASTEKWSFNKN